jgi:hypothetical protein
VGEAQVLRIQAANAEPLLDIFRGFGGPELSEESVRVAIVNGTGASNLATEVSAELAAAGFATARVGEAESFDNEVSVLRFAPADREAAELLLRYTVNDPLLKEVLTLDDARLQLVVGADWAGLKVTPDPPSPSATTAATPSETPTVTPESNSTGDAATAEATTAAEQDLEEARLACIG